MENPESKIINIFQELGYLIDEHLLEDFMNTENKFKQMSNKEILQAIKKGSIIEKKPSEFSYLERIKLIHYKNISENKFELITDSKIKNYNRTYTSDGIIAINEIPLAMIETQLKVDNACFVLQSYLSTTYITEKLKTVQLMIAIGEDGIKYKSSSLEATWNTWKVFPMNNLEENVKTFFNKEHFLNIIRNFTFHMNGQNLVPRYYQYEAVEAVINSHKKQNKIYMPTGTGKTTTMLLLIEKLQNQDENTKMVIVIDQLIVQDMIKKRIMNELLKEVVIANNVVDLENMINSIKSDIIITTIQKLSLYNSKYLGKINIITDLSSEYYEENMEDIQIKCFPNSTLIQFTSFKKENEKYEFYYSENQATEDGVIVPIFYEQRRPLGDLNIENIVENIKLNSKNVYLKGKKSIIITKEKNVIKYINKLRKTELIATSTIIKNIEDKEFFEDIIRENENLVNYTIDSMMDFNYGKLEILVVTTLEELKKITTNEVCTVYLDKELQDSMLQEILKIISQKSKGKERSFIRDYAYNQAKIEKYLSENENQKEKFVSEISKIINDTRIQYCKLIENEKNIKNKIEDIKSLNYRVLKEEIKEYKNNLIIFLQLINFVYSSDELLKILENDEKARYKKNTLTFIELLDNLAVICAEEIKDKKLIQKYCMKLGINFEFTPINKDNLEKFPILNGAWKKLNVAQTAEAIKNNIKLFAVDAEKIRNDLDTLTQKFKLNRITENEYFSEIEKYRVQYVEKIKEDRTPKKLKDSQFAMYIYYKMENLLEENKIQLITELKLEDIVLKIENIIKSNIKVGWKNNTYLWRKIELKIIEQIYDNLNVKEEILKNLLKEIKEIAFETINLSIDVTQNNIYYIKKKNAYAVGIKKGNDMYVLKNSTTVDGLSENLSECFKKIARDLRKEEIIVNNKFVKDYKFTSPSTAAAVILGRNSNGRIEWKDKYGRTITQNEEE